MKGKHGAFAWYKLISKEHAMTHTQKCNEWSFPLY